LNIANDLLSFLLHLPDKFSKHETANYSLQQHNQ
jgi:hypothetical protein